MPHFSYTHQMVEHLMGIEGARRVVDVLPLPPDSAFLLRFEALRRSTHFSTSIEGNQLPLDKVREGIAQADRTGSRQDQEVRNYWTALEWLEQQVEARALVDEQFIRRLHRIIIVRGRGRRGEMSDYRERECPVVDSATGQIDYAPPAPADVPGLMASLVAWRNSKDAAALPAPIRAGILGYQFVTIHPFGDGNGRTARALATAELWFAGYGMRGFLSLEEHYYRDLQRYYDSLQMGLDPDYYRGRSDPDLTPWLEYFSETMAAAASDVERRAEQLREFEDHPAAPWEQLPRRQQQLLCRLVIEHPEAGQGPTFSPADVAKWFMVSLNTARAWIREWCEKGLLQPAGGRQRVTSWRLADGYRGLLDAVRSATQQTE